MQKNPKHNNTTTLKWLVTVPLFLVICQCGALLVLEKLNIFKNVIKRFVLEKKYSLSNFPIEFSLFCFHIKSRFYLLSCHDMLFIYFYLQYLKRKHRKVRNSRLSLLCLRVVLIMNYILSHLLKRTQRNANSKTKIFFKLINLQSIWSCINKWSNLRTKIRIRRATDVVVVVMCLMEKVIL